ncbi:MAG: flagellar hook-length control protein FliK [Clostridiaceae bacterium]|nr:flagellar hook-length control protein FliK [Clostridiaceae bacterium]
MPEIAIGLPLIPTQAAQVGRGTSKGSEDACVLPEGEFAGLLEQMKGKGDTKSKSKSSMDTGEGSTEEKEEPDQKTEYIYCICPQITDAVIPKIRLLNDQENSTADIKSLEAVIPSQIAAASGVIAQEAPAVSEVWGNKANSAMGEDSASAPDFENGTPSFSAPEIQGDTETIAVLGAEEKPFVNSRASGIRQNDTESKVAAKLHNNTDTGEAVYSTTIKSSDTEVYYSKSSPLSSTPKSDSLDSASDIKNDLKAKVEAEAEPIDIENKKDLKPQENIKKLYDTPKEKEGNNIPIEHSLSAAPEKTVVSYQDQGNVRKEIIEARPEMQLTQAINENLSKGRDRFTVKLKPEGLGEVTVRLALNGDTLAVSIRSSEHSTNDLIGSRLDELRSSLEEGGCKVGLLNLETQAQGGESSKQGNSSSQRAAPQYEEADTRSVRTEGKALSETAARVIGYKSGIINYRV